MGGHVAELEQYGNLKADVFVCAGGCHYNNSPKFLRELGIGAYGHWWLTQKVLF